MNTFEYEIEQKEISMQRMRILLLMFEEFTVRAQENDGVVF